MKSHTKFLSSIAQKLDITRAEYDKATKIAEDLANHLSCDDQLKDHLPMLYMQGSFRLGTVVRPISEGAEYDVDLVCELSADNKGTISQDQLKKIIGDSLKKHPDYGNLFEPKSRCWTAKIDKKFKIDIVPAIPDLDSSSGGILIQDKSEYRWQKTNPKGYYEWFKSINLEHKSRLDASVDIENLEGLEKSTLQQVVQILKRLRDIQFEDNPELKPSSVIITTLAAKHYRGEHNIFEALLNIAQQLKVYDGTQEISISKDEENFADRLNSDDSLKKAFCDWVNYVAERCDSLEKIDNLENIQEFANIGFGHYVSNAVFQEDDFGFKNKALNIHYPGAKIIKSEAPKPWVVI